MGIVKGIVIAAVAALVGVFGFSYVRNPDLGVGQHAEAVGFVLANPVSTSEWQGLACPHRRAVVDLVAMSIAPKLCGAASDGGAKARAEKFKTQGLGSCWALYQVLSQRDEERYRSYFNKAKPHNATVSAYCTRAEALLKKAG
ncbi:MAG: hypothetical protein RLZ98_2276 [Pseudomonadota bacterium]|jgi:hypothetical protein